MTATSQKTIDIPLVVNAWGTSADGRAPHFKLLVDGAVVGEAYVSATASTPYSFQITVDPDQPHTIGIWYDNDATVNGVDRNLFVGSILVDGQTIASTDLRASYDKGAVDGKDVAKGQQGLYWGGELSFGLGEEVFGGPATQAPPKPEEVVTKPTSIVVDARSTAGTSSHVTVLVDGQAIGGATVTGTAVTAFVFQADLDPSVPHTVQVVGDGGTAGSLTVSALVVNGQTVAVASAQSSPTAAAPLTVAVAAPVIQGTASAAPAPSGAAYYVAANGKDSWSGTLAAPNADGTDGPFATLARAQAAMQGSAVKTTYVREGTYQLSQTLQLTAQDSGVSILGYPGEQAVLSGGQTVTGFVYEGNGVWSAPLSAAPGFDVTVDGVRCQLASKAAYDPNDPTSGWYVADAAGGGASTTTLRYHAGDIAAADLVPGTMIEVYDSERLQNAIVTVAGIDETTRTITLKSAAPFTMGDGSTYKLLGNSAFVDQAGEFAYRASDGRLVINAGSGANLSTANVQVARLGTLIGLNGANGVTIQGLTFTNTTTDGDALALSNADGNTIAGNSFLNVGTGIHLRLGSDGNVISGNYLDHLGINGVMMEGQSNGNTVTNNRIQHIGEIRSYAAGIMGAGVSDTEISHNDIDHSARYGISLKNWSADTVNLDNRVIDNRVRNTGERTADSGAIEILGRSGLDTGLIIRGNWIEHAGGIATTADGQWLIDYKGFGIYLDDMTSGVTVTGNFLRDTAWASVMIHGGHDNTVTGNFAILASNDEDFLRIEWNPVAGAAGNPYNNTVTGNLIDGTVPLGSYLTLLSPGTVTIDANFLHNIATYGSGDLSGNPLFTDAYDHDYSLSAGSPVLADGIHDLDWAAMGVIDPPPPSPPVTATPQSVGDPTPVGGSTPTAPGSGGQTASPQTSGGSAAATVLFDRYAHGVAGTVAASAYTGPVAGLQWQYLGDAGDEVVNGSSGNDFINLGAGNDAINAGSGDDVLDGGTGSNWLSGGSGKDTFFVDGRDGGITWSTVTDLEKGEWATIWGFKDGASKLTWQDMAGADGFKGATVYCDLDGNGTIDASMTFTGVSASSLLIAAGATGDAAYLALTLR